MASEEKRPYYWGSAKTHEEYLERTRQKYKNFSPEYRDKIRSDSREKRARLKKAIFALLGDKCSRCGFIDPRALQIDHIHGGGCKHKAKYSGGIVYYKHLLEIPDLLEKFQLLCANCNWIKRWENGEVRK